MAPGAPEPGAGPPVRIRTITAAEIPDLWSIDRAELIEGLYRLRDGELVLAAERQDVRGWPAGEPERDEPMLVECLDRGGSAWGAFEGDRLVGASVLESRFIGSDARSLQLKFLHVGRDHRGTGLGVRLFEKAATRARELGATRMYVSATPSQNTIGFYLRRGCHVAAEVDPELFALEPEDIHLEVDL